VEANLTNGERSLNRGLQKRIKKSEKDQKSSKGLSGLQLVHVSQSNGTERFTTWQASVGWG
jgi:hypothetical protein